VRTLVAVIGIRITGRAAPPLMLHRTVGTINCAAPLPPSSELLEESSRLFVDQGYTMTA